MQDANAFAAKVLACATGIALTPSLVVLVLVVWRRRRDEVPPGPRRTSRRSSLSIRSHLHVAKWSASQRRLRVSGVMVQFGWLLLVFGMAPTVVYFAGRPIDSVVDSNYMAGLIAPGVYLLLLGILPTDSRAIRVACAMFMLMTGLGPVALLSAITGGLPAVLGYSWGVSWTILCFVMATTLRCRAVEPRTALRRLWLVARLGCITNGLPNVGFLLVMLARNSDWFEEHPDDAGGLFNSLVSLLCASVATPANRGRVHRLLGRGLGGQGTEAEEASLVAALIGAADPAAALSNAAALFRALPATQLHKPDLADGKERGDSLPTLNERTIEASLGEVTCFLSHSWADETTAPGAKYSAFRAWADDFEATNNKEPTLWLDKACISQDNISQSLACLPIFLAGCQQLVALVGPTYTVRLWCILELFAFLHMGGSVDRIEVLPISGEHDGATALRVLSKQIANFDASKAKCFFDKDRQRILAVIESGFGDSKLFNHVVRNVLTSRTRRVYFRSTKRLWIVCNPEMSPTNSQRSLSSSFRRSSESQKSRRNQLQRPSLSCAKVWPSAQSEESSGC